MMTRTITLRDKPYLAVRDVEGEELVWRIGKGTPLPADLPLIVGDFLQTLRASLDHIAWELRDRCNWKSEHAMFVIADTPERFEASRQRRIGGLLREQQDLIESFQKYERTNPDVPLTAGGHLYLLNELARFDRHRTIPIIATPRRGYSYGLAGNVDTKDLFMRQPFGPLDYGDVFFRLPISLYPHMQQEPEVAFTINFAEPKEAQNFDITLLCQSMYVIVNRDVLPAFSSLFPEHLEPYVEIEEQG